MPARESWAGWCTRILDNSISGKIAKQVFEAMWEGEGSADEIIDARGLKQVSDSTASWRRWSTPSLRTASRQVTQYLAADEAKRKKVAGLLRGPGDETVPGPGQPADGQRVAGEETERPGALICYIENRSIRRMRKDKEKVLDEVWTEDHVRSFLECPLT